MSAKKTDGEVFSAARPAAANFAAEKPRKRRKPIDKLEYDVIQAERLGYGCHYGRYKADHPKTQAEYETQHGKPAQKVDNRRVVRSCLRCGAQFTVGSTHANKMYCCDDCRIKAQQDRLQNRGQTLYCVWCGGEIPRDSQRTRYCCRDHYYAAGKEQDRKKREAAKNGNN